MDDDDPLGYWDECTSRCTDKRDDQGALCISGFNPGPLLIQTGTAHEMVCREATTHTPIVDALRNVMVRQSSIVDDKVDDSVPVITPNEVYPREETLSYEQQSKHKVVGMMKDITIVADGDKDGLKFSCLKESSNA